jgi:hypothetical protein
VGGISPPLIEGSLYIFFQQFAFLKRYLYEEQHDRPFMVLIKPAHNEMCCPTTIVVDKFATIKRSKKFKTFILLM